MDRFLRKAEHVVKDHILKDVLGIDDDEDAHQEQAQNQQAHAQQNYGYSNQAHEDDDHNEQSHNSPGPSSQPSNHPVKIRPVDTAHRFQSFAPETSGNAKWYVDGASYFWAVSMAIEEARESIYILDWWLSPELYLRRPPSKNEKYRLDNMLKAAAERGVDVKIIVYKEVPQALTLDSAHTRHALEALHPKISVFRHPDHLPTSRARLQQAFAGLSLDNLKMNSFGLAKVSGDALKELYGSFGDTVLYWAHHEKLCVVDRHTVFMGGLDMCFGRYDTNSHPIADAHPGNLDSIVFPGQDFNNARVYDFEGVNNWDHNQLDRANNCRMGWSDIAISLSGGIVNSLIDHFTDRWNFIFEDKYDKKNPGKYQKLQEGRGGGGGDQSPPYPDHEGFENRLTRGVRHFMGDEEEGHHHRRERSRDQRGNSGGGAQIQLCRSASDWSAGHPTEHSIANAYVHAIESAKHYVYIENQFFITATGNKQYPIENTIGASIVSRIVRAHSNRENFRVIVLMPAVPAFAGDLKSDGALGTRAIMEYQYNSINRGGNSIIECLRKQGVDDWQQYIGFYNLRNYDRINISSTMSQAEGRSGVRYDDARRQHDDIVGRRDEEGYRDQYDRDRGSGDEWDGERPNLLYPRDEDQYDGGHHGRSRHDRDRYDDDRYEEDRYDEDRYDQGGYDRDRRDRDRRDRQRYERDEYDRDDRDEYDQRRYDQDRYDQDRYDGGRQDRDQYDRYQSAAAKVPDRTWDTVSSCYMDGGPDIRTVPWHGDEESEINAFVSEELYIHSKVLIADDRLVICGSANLNDRSQLGHHDSEIAVVIEDQDFVEGSMDGRPYRAARFATSLRRQLWRKHLGWLPDQPWDQPTQNWTPVTRDPQDYDWGSEADQAVADPMSDELWRIWTKTARTNTEVFSKVFHNVPNDKVRTWEDYDDFFSKHFIIPGADMKDKDKEGRVDYGHVVREEFPGGAEELKEWLSRVRGTLVEMPLEFLIDVKDLAKEGLSLNAFTDELYT